MGQGMQPEQVSTLTHQGHAAQRGHVAQGRWQAAQAVVGKVQQHQLQPTQRIRELLQDSKQKTAVSARARHPHTAGDQLESTLLQDEDVMGHHDSRIAKSRPAASVSAAAYTFVFLHVQLPKNDRDVLCRVVTDYQQRHQTAAEKAQAAADAAASGADAAAAHHIRLPCDGVTH